MANTQISLVNIVCKVSKTQLLTALDKFVEEAQADELAQYDAKILRRLAEEIEKKIVAGK